MGVAGGRRATNTLIGVVGYTGEAARRIFRAPVEPGGAKAAPDRLLRLRIAPGCGKAFSQRVGGPAETNRPAADGPE